MSRTNPESTTALPRVSVCVALYNHAAFVDEAIDSILAQTFQDFEIVIVDDGSTDGSLARVKERAAREPRIRVFTHPNGEHRGISAACNRAILESRGEFVTFIASDDTLYPDSLELQLAALAADPGIDLVYGLVELMTEDGLPMGKTRGYRLDPQLSQLEAIIAGCAMPSTTIMARRECFDRVGLLDESLVYGDWEICIRLLSQYRTGFIDRPLARYRVHATNTSIGPGVSPEKVRGDALDVLFTLRHKVDQLGSDRERILRVVEASIRNVERRFARMCVDRFVASAGDGDFDLSSLKAAWSSSPRDVYRSRRTPLILFGLLRGSLGNVLLRKA
jgi:glycosyltransferase involved in cell wall biosynthesis